ncbi:agmatine deiminase family protein [Chlorobaculum thiosulfatiphilum]|uniref:Agmatine deiminase family protein n=1 Tax=Chlorobaculum thiosulfatiphilum TaxID=115852 RepID=A0A5C4S539_CHLTI|nr:agmatine deiminase family protein [Chlorobaculum thiosulfatiphilum]TNJ38352.1 agmatine deiminase family protein [Chlorobaculum thiosulfatiphilum]
MSEPTYFMPPEWAHHTSTWLSWPHKLESWPGKFEPVPAVFAELAYQLSRSETVNINVLDDAMESQARALLKERDPEGKYADRIVFHRIPTNDAWCRDHGPNYVIRTRDGQREKVIMNWEYNAWGGKYEPYDDDNAVPERVAKIQGLPMISTGMVLEGGAIDVNGAGLLLTTTACLLNPNRNPSLSKEDIEAQLKCYLGIEKVLWLGDGIAGDDTDGHVDDMARFVSENTVVITVEEDPEDENYQILQENYELLKTMTGLDEKPLNVVKLPMPEPVYYDGERLPASYANFYIANTVVLIPTYRCSRDQQAIDILQQCFPGREVIGIDCSDLIWGLGAIHCVTHEEPEE